MTKPNLILLAGGQGTRLRGVTGSSIPKPMVEIDGVPFLQLLITHYIEQGFKNIYVSTNYLAATIEHYKFKVDGVHLTFVRDPFHVRSKFDSIDYLCKNYTGHGAWIVNADTFIPEPLPEILHESHAVVVAGDKDAGAQYVSGRNQTQIMVHKTKTFYDIGTPDGLERFKKYWSAR